MLQAGLTYKQKRNVTKKDTADQVGSGSLAVYGTPAMIAFIENTALKAVEEELEDNQTTVGTKVNINHLRPTPVGERVICSVELRAVNGSQLQFNVEVEDENNKIGEGTHTRYIVNKDTFMEKVDR